jgi:hypothetical protein
LDGRTGAVRVARTLIANLESDLGGAERLSAAERVLCQRAAVCAAMLEDLEARWLTGAELDTGAWCALANVLRRLLQTVGMERRAADVTSLVSKRTVSAIIGSTMARRHILYTISRPAPKSYRDCRRNSVGVCVTARVSSQRK